MSSLHPASGRVSIGDVARLAGVSPITVSRVANGSDSVRPGTRDKVVAAMAKLGYAPNHAARALRSGSFGTIGVVAHRLDRTGESRTVQGIVTAARAEGFSVTLVDVQEPTSDAVAEAARTLGSQAVDGLVLIRAETITPSSLALPTSMPVVVSESDDLTGGHAAVGSDQATGVRRAVEHLLEMGHDTVHHIAGPSGSASSVMREAAWRTTLAQAGRSIQAPLRGDWSPRSGQELADALPADATAVFCSNDEMAIGLMSALHRRGVRVPEDLSVVGFDDIPLSEFVWPPLTTVRQHFARIGAELVNCLLRRMRGPAAPIGEHLIVPTEFVPRASSGPRRIGRGPS